MFKFILPLILLVVSSVATAETIYFAKPTAENAKAHVQHKEKANVHEIIWLVDPETGDTNRFLIESYQDKDSANADLVVNVENVGMSTEMQVFAKGQADNFQVAKRIANEMNGVEFDAYDWMIFQDLALEILLKNRFEPVITNFEKQGEVFGYFEFETKVSKYEDLKFTTKKGFTIVFDLKLTGVGGFEVTVRQIRNASGVVLWPKSSFLGASKIRLINTSLEELNELAGYISVQYNYSFPNGVPSSVPKGSVIFIACKSAIHECDVTIRPENNKQ